MEGMGEETGRQGRREEEKARGVVVQEWNIKFLAHTIPGSKYLVVSMWLWSLLSLLVQLRSTLAQQLLHLGSVHVELFGRLLERVAHNQHILVLELLVRILSGGESQSVSHYRRTFVYIKIPN